jgi:hypothetical protein
MKQVPSMTKLGAVSLGERRAVHASKLFAVLTDKITALMFANAQDCPACVKTLWGVIFSKQCFKDLAAQSELEKIKEGKVVGGGATVEAYEEAIKTSLGRLWAMKEHGTSYRRAHRQLLSVVAHLKGAKEVIETFDVSAWQVQKAREHHHRCFGGAPVEAEKHEHCVISEETALHILGYRVRHDVVEFNMASARNSSAKRILLRKNKIGVQFRLYKAECDSKGIKPLGRTKFYEAMSSSIYTDKKIDDACCEWCLDFGHAMFEDIEDLINEVSSFYVGGCKIREQTLRLLKAARLHFEGSIYSTHCRDTTGVTEPVCAMHCQQYGLSDPNEACFRAECAHDHHMNCATCNLVFYLEVSLAVHCCAVCIHWYAVLCAVFGI